MGRQSPGTSPSAGGSAAGSAGWSGSAGFLRFRRASGRSLRSFGKVCPANPAGPSCGAFPPSAPPVGWCRWAVRAGAPGAGSPPAPQGANQIVTEDGEDAAQIPLHRHQQTDIHGAVLDDIQSVDRRLLHSGAVQRVGDIGLLRRRGHRRDVVGVLGKKGAEHLVHQQGHRGGSALRPLQRRESMRRICLR